jgi:serine/threonine protein kinase/MFS family permease
MADRVGQQLGTYRLLRLLGRGNFAEVYLSEHLYLKSLAALKVLRTELSDEDVASFLAEGQALARLKHPQIVRVHDFAVEQGIPFLVMDYAPQGTIRQHYPRGSCLSLETVVTYVRDVAGALQYAHNRNVIHRDVKPENILLGTHREALLSDFGLALFAPSPELLSTQKMAGTLPYMAPEQLQGKPGFASDQYALAIIVYEWLCGVRPFEGSYWQLANQHMSVLPPPLREKDPSLPAEVERVVLKALAKNPEQRYVSVQLFAQALERAIQVGVGVPRIEAEMASTLSAISPPVQEETDVSASEEGLLEETPDEPRNPLKNAPVSLEVRTQPLLPAFAQGIRKRLLQRVQSFWIEGVLDHSLHGSALIALGLQEQPEAVAHPWRLVLQQSETGSRLLPTGTRVIEIYDAAEGELLILGAPGSGKTTLLLELARDLLERAKQDELYPPPMVFNLSSWTMKQLPLVDWLVEELVSKYQVPRKLAQELVDMDQILPLLDDLDEVDANDRSACIAAINAYRREHGMSSLVVCSRSTDYLTQATRLQLGCAVEIQPLASQQIDDYLRSAGEPLEALRIALRQDGSLREITSNPLMLSILTLTYYGSAVEDLSGASSPADRQRQVFEHYIERVLQRQGTTPFYPSQHIIRWLAWLAQQMKRHGQTVFYIERMQPDWLPESWSHRPYYRVLVRLGIGIASGMIMSLTLAIAIGLFIGAGLGPRIGFVSGLIGGLVGGLAGGLVMALTNRIETEIRPAEVIIWSWRRLVQVRSFKRKLIVGISSGLTFGLLIGLILVVSGSSSVNPLVLLGVPLTVVAIFMLAGGLTSGVSTTLQNERDLALPNQGMRQSARNSIRIGIVSALVGGSISIGIFFLILKLIGAIFAKSINELCFLLLCGAIGGTISGLIVGLSNGGIASIQHLVLRVLLWHAKCLPLNYPRFLDYAAERILLCKVGGGYMFVHRLLLDYFASRAAELYLGREVEQEQIRKGATQQIQESLTAIAHITLEDDNTALVGKSYTAYAGISQSTPDNFVGEAFQVSVQHNDKPIPFDICLHTSENIELTSPWHKHLLYDLHNLDPHLTEFTFQVKLSGKSYVVVDFYHERHWLRTIRFDFKAVEQAERAEVTFGV